MPGASPPLDHRALCGAMVTGGSCRVMRRVPGLARWEGFDDDHAPATARAWRTGVGLDFGLWRLNLWRDGKQAAGERKIVVTCGAGEQAVMAEAVGFEPTVSLHPRRFSRPLP